MKCCGSHTRDPDPAGSPCPRCPRPALAGPRAGSTPQSGPAQAAAAVRSPRLLGSRPQLCSAAAVAGRQRRRGEPLARQTAGGLRPGHLRWLQPGRALGHRGGRRSPGPRPRPPCNRRTAPRPTGGGRGTGVSDDHQERRLLPQLGFQDANPQQLMVLSRYYIKIKIVKIHQTCLCRNKNQAIKKLKKRGDETNVHQSTGCHLRRQSERSECLSEVAHFIDQRKSAASIENGVQYGSRLKSNF
jgi:hypothetical protein